MAASTLAVVTGASTGIGFELAKLAAAQGHDLIIAADEPSITDAAQRIGGSVQAVQADLATTEGVDKLLAAVAGRPIGALLANAGRGLGRAFVEQSWDDIKRVIDTNIVGTTYLLHKVAAEMQRAGSGRILITGSIAGFLPGTYQAVYNASKAYLDLFSEALRAELKDSGVTVTCLQPGATQTEFFERADMMDTKVGTDEKDDPAMVAKVGFDAMLAGTNHVVAGFRNKLQAAIAHVAPDTLLSEIHRGMAEPGTAKR